MTTFKLGERAKIKSRAEIDDIPAFIENQEVTITGALEVRQIYDLFTKLPSGVPVLTYIIQFDGGLEIVTQPFALKKLTDPDEWASQRVRELLAPYQRAKEPADA